MRCVTGLVYLSDLINAVFFSFALKWSRLSVYFSCYYYYYYYYYLHYKLTLREKCLAAQWSRTCVSGAP